VRVIGALAAGEKIPGAASTAAVKSTLDATNAIVNEYKKSCDAVLATVARVPDLSTAGKYAHPWFGPLDASDWDALVGGPYSNPSCSCGKSHCCESYTKV
jgi:hypothetical protein